MQIKLIESQARYWERLYSLQDSSRILHLAFTEHLELMEKQKKCWGSSSITFIRKIWDIDGFDFPPSAAAAVRASAHQRLNIALTENEHTSFSDHRDYYTHSALYQHAEHMLMHALI